MEKIVEFIGKLLMGMVPTGLPSLLVVIKDFFSFQFMKDLVSLPSVLSMAGIVLLDKAGNVSESLSNVGSVKCAYLSVPEDPESAADYLKKMLNLILALLAGIISIPIDILGCGCIVPRSVYTFQVG